MENDFIEEPVLADDEDEEQSHGHSKKHKHDKLIDSIVHLGGKKRKVTLRTESVGIPNNLIASTQTSSASKKIKSHQLLSSLKKTSSLQVQTLNKQLAKVNKHQAVLQQPLQKPQAEKAERIAAYDQEKKSLTKWDPIVEKNRTAETLNFPLQNGGVQFQTTQEFVGKFKPLSSLEKDIAAILQTSNNNIQPDSLLTQAEKKIISKMDLLEAKQKLNELKKNACSYFLSTSKIQTSTKNQE
jgi:U3 small nucleolar RNA-associated protein 14